MRRGELRQKILDECPDDFLDKLKNWIDEVEQMAKDPLVILDSVDGLDDLHLIEDARDALDNFCEALY